MKKIISLFACAVLFAPFIATADAAPVPCAVEGTPFLTVTEPITEPDSGNVSNWATDTFTETAVVWVGTDNTTLCASGSTTGTFVTTGPNDPQTGLLTLPAGITGTFSGNETWVLTGLATTTGATSVVLPADNSLVGSQFNNWQSSVLSGTAGASTYSFTYVVDGFPSDTWTNADTGNLGNILDEVTATAQNVTVPENGSIGITLGATEVSTTLPLTFATTTSPTNGTWDGTTYTPNTGYNGSDSFTFTASDGINTSDPATVSITVTPTPVPPPTPTGGGAMTYDSGPLAPGYQVGTPAPFVPSPAPATTTTSTTTPAFVFTRHLYRGLTGNDVSELQGILIADGYLNIPAPTGWFGPLTFAAVKEYQAANGIPSTGYVGVLTLASLNS